jgi:hypothetical protein
MRCAVVVLLVLLMMGCATHSPAAPVVPAHSVNEVATNVSLPRLIIRLSLGQGPTRTNLTVAQGLDLTIVALNSNFTLENQELGIRTTIPAGEEAAVRIAPRVPGRYVLRCTTGCPAGRDTISVTTRQAAG